MKIFKTLLALTALAAVTAPQLTAQTNSPYSKFGYGLLNDNATASQRQMGGVGYAMNSGRQINVWTPAPSENSDKSTGYGGGLDYVTMQVPIGRYMGASLGLVPFSSVGYSFGSEITHGHNAHEGTGGLNQLYLGFAGRPFKGFSIGANFSYLFGTTINAG